MARVLLVTYSGYIKTPSSLALDNGLANLAGALRAKGHVVRIEDFNTLSVLKRMTPPGLAEKAGDSLVALNRGDADSFASIRKLQDVLDCFQAGVVEELFEELCHTIENLRVDVVGFKCWGSDGAIALKRWCASLRERFPRIKILLGGPLCQVFPEQTARYLEHFDFMALHEAEQTILDIVDHVEGRLPLRKVRGVLFRRDGVFFRTEPALIDHLDRLPYPDYGREVYPAAWTGDKLNLVVLDESRGCPIKCRFCVHPSYAGSWRMKSVDRIISEVRAVQEQLGVRYFRFAGSNTPFVLLCRLAERILSEGIDMRFSCFLHTSGVREEWIPALYRAGLRSVFYGVETADDELLLRVGNKKTDSAKSFRALSATSKSGIFTTGSFMFPMPFETEESRAKTFAFVRDLFGNNRFAAAQFLNPVPLPGTEWWKDREKYGFEFDDEAYCSKNIALPVRHMFPPELQELLPYSLNGKSHRDLAVELGRFMNELRPHNILVNISDDVAIIAYGCGQHPADLRAEMMPAFMKGDIAKIETMVRRFNANRCQETRLPRGSALEASPQPS